MNDDLEKQLDEFYRKLDGSARRVESRWKARPATRRSAAPGTPRLAAWIGSGVAAAAAILLLVLALRSEEKPRPESVVKVVPPAVEPEPRVIPPAPQPPRPAPVEHPKVELPTPVPAPKDPIPVPPEEPRTPERPAPAPKPETPKREEPPPTKVVRVVAMLREVEGSFDLADKALRGKQKDLAVAAGDRLRATSAVKITLADDRLLLLAPRALVEFRPEEKRLCVLLEQGDLLADLVGPGPELRVQTRSCDITPLGTVFAVKVDPGRVMITVEKGRVEVQSPKGRATLRAAEALQAADDGSLGPAVPADPRSLVWARSHRAPELALFVEDFSKPGAWTAEIDKGVARATARPGGGAVLHLPGDKPLFEVPMRGALSLSCRSDRTGKFKIQFYCPEFKCTYVRMDIPIGRGDAWRTMAFDFDQFTPTDKSKPARVPPGTAVTDFLIMYGDEGERGSFWVDSIKVTELRP